jgi:hypothetical protein
MSDKTRYVQVRMDWDTWALLSGYRDHLNTHRISRARRHPEEKYRIVSLSEAVAVLIHQRARHLLRSKTAYKRRGARKTLALLHTGGSHRGSEEANGRLSQADL